VRVVIQRVSEASVTIDQKIKSKIGSGLLILLGVEPDDDDRYTNPSLKNFKKSVN